ncbi:MAG: hypothetical protein IK031_06845 [Bacteroidales bacterium]|nr:hypothetical protein [Bacteroidales bacterium]
MKKSALLSILPILILAVSCFEKVPTYSFAVQTTVGAGESNYYEGLTLQFGKAGSTDVLEEAVVENGKAVFTSEHDYSDIVGQNVWFGVRNMVKFFHTIDADEWATGTIVLPDKEQGSTVKGNENDWIVAIYIGINKDGKADGVPIYWATGNLIAVKLTDEGVPTEVAFHVATAEETAEESVATSTEFVGRDKRLKSTVPDCYVDMPKGSKWDVYCFGNYSATMLYDGTELDKYVIDSGQMVGDKIYWDISGMKEFDIATHLGGLWRTPTGGKTGLHELAALEDDFEEYKDLKPDHETVGENGVNISALYKHTVVIDSREICVNTLILPSAGFRHALNAQSRGTFIGLWSATADPTCTPVFFGTVGDQMPEIEAKPQTTAFAYSCLTKQTTWYAHPRTSSISIRPVTE